ncbi:unnamed protein product [Brassica oleracea var. botrytis]
MELGAWDNILNILQYKKNQFSGRKASQNLRLSCLFFFSISHLRVYKVSFIWLMQKSRPCAQEHLL